MNLQARGEKIYKFLTNEFGSVVWFAVIRNCNDRCGSLLWFHFSPQGDGDSIGFDQWYEEFRLAPGQSIDQWFHATTLKVFSFSCILFSWKLIVIQVCSPSSEVSALRGGVWFDKFYALH